VVKEHLKARDDEIRAMIVSTEWKELLLPFSRFVDDTSMDIRGVKINVDEKTYNITKTDVVPLRVNCGRVLSPWHEISLYSSAARLEEGVSSYDQSCRAKGIYDYVMVLMTAPDGFYESSVAATAKGLAAIRGDETVSDEDIQELMQKMERLEYIIYFVPQMQTAEEYLEMIKRSPALYEEAKYFLEEMDEEEALSSLQSYALSVAPEVDRDYYDIGYPAKFKSKLIEQEGWSINAIVRRGAFARNQLLTDEIIVAEICGEAGTSGQRFKRMVSLSSKAEFSQCIDDLGECLINNAIWFTQLRQQLEEARADFPTATARISVFVPTTGVFTIFFAANLENGILYVPEYSIAIEDGGVLRRIYFGELVPTSEDVMPSDTFSKLLAKHYWGDLGMLVMLMTSGGYEHRDVDVLEDLNLAYSSFRCDVEADKRTFFRQQFNRWRSQSSIKPFEAFFKYLNNNARLVHLISTKLGPRVGGTICDGSSALRQLEDGFSESVTLSNVKFSPPSNACAVCTSPFSVEPAIVEASTHSENDAVLVCADCGVYVCDDISRVYTKNMDGDWQLVADVDLDEGSKYEFEKLRIFRGGL
jgi:hypothetical protein